MNRRTSSVLGTAVALALAAATVPGVAQAAPRGKPAKLPKTVEQTTKRPDDRPGPLELKRRAAKQLAADRVATGKAKAVQRHGSRVVDIGKGDWVEYQTQETHQLLTFLVEFGDTNTNPNPDWADITGPRQGEIDPPAPGDNSTYWKPDFDRQHYLDMFFNGMPEQGGESFRGLYQEMSSGRFDLEGDVSDWVQVDKTEASYQDGDGVETEAGMADFLQDSVNAWYDDQKAKGKTDEEIVEYLDQFDVWDRYDLDGDGNYNEPDGYIDHFQAVHAGTGEEDGVSPPWALWSHRASISYDPSGTVGPADFAKVGGIKIGDTDKWIFDYTTEPENGGLGVFAHEFGHDLGLPDYYDTVSNVDNSTGFWNLMSSGEWLGHGDGTVGTTPNHIGAPDKLFLGWYGPGDLAIVDGTKAPASVTLGPSYHATNIGAQAVSVTLPQGSSTVEVVEPDQGTRYLYSGNGDARTATATSPPVEVPAADPTLSARVSYAIEDDWDYAYLQVSGDGGLTWDNVETDRSTSGDPHGQNEGFGITGCSGTRDDGVCDNAWTDLSADLTAYAGQTVSLRFAMVNDQATHQLGLSVDSIALGGALLTDVEDRAAGWTLDGFRVMDGSSYTTVYDRYYLAENRQYRGYDKTLAQGPYSWDYLESAPTKVDHYPYQDGLLIWYLNGLYADNNTSSHPGGGQALVVDANPEYQLWWDADDNAVDYGDGRVNGYDATFDVDQADGLHLVKELGGSKAYYDVETHPSTPVFEDSDPDAYWDDWGGQIGPVPGFFSTKVAGVGTEIQVVSSDEKTGRMVVKVGARFVANTSGASIAGTPAVGQTLTAVAPTWFQGGVSPTYRWMVDGQTVDGAVGPTYAVGLTDLGRKISVAVVGSKTGYVATRVVSGAVTVASGTAPVATTAPAVSGQARVGQRLTVTPGVWPVGGTSSFTWKAGGRTVGTGPAYVLKPGDVGQRVTVTETRTAAGYRPGSATSAATAAVAPAQVGMTVKAPKKVKRGKKAKVRVVVTSPGLVPAGTVTIRYAGKKVATKRLAGGVVTVKLPKQTKKGKKRLVVVYKPATGFSAARRTLTVKVK